MNLKKTKHIPTRMCAGCGQMKEKKDLIRIVKVSDENKKYILLDLKGKAQGRGIYVCKDLDCLKKLKKNKRIERTFKFSYDENLYDKIEEEILNAKE